MERHPERFVGLTVTLVGKEAIRWENTTITEVDGRDLLLAGGDQVTQVFSGSPVRKPIAGRSSRVPCWEIARGNIADAVRRSGRRFTECGQIRAHLAAGGDQPWQDPRKRRYAREVAKDLAADLVEIEPLADGWLFAGRFESTGPWATWQSVTGIQTPYGIFWHDLDDAHRFAKTIADWADWSQPQTGNRFRWGCCGDSRRLAFTAKRTRDPDWTYTPRTPMATVEQVGEAMRLEGRLRGRYPDLVRPHTAAQLGDWTRDRIEVYLCELGELGQHTATSRQGGTA